jgi:hypothetical protein
MPEEQVFISYSHQDKDWLERLQTHLKPYLRAGSIKSWSDQEITPSSKWFEEIKSALTDAKVAVLLVTPDFLASDFIHEHELVPLLKEAEQGGVKILWVPIRDSAYKRTPLKNYQAVLSPDTPLAAMTKAKRDQAWVRICEEIEKAVNPSKEPFSEDSLRDAAPQSAPPIVAPPVGQKPELSPEQAAPARRNVLPVIGAILTVMIVALVSLFLWLRNNKQPVQPDPNYQRVGVANEVKIGDKIFLGSREGSYVITATQISKTNWPRLGNEGKVLLTLLGDGPLRNGSVVQIQSLESNLNGNDVLEADNHNCYYWKRNSDEKKQHWIITKLDASNPVLFYGDKIYLVNAYYDNERLTKNSQNGDYLTIDKEADWWWKLEKRF